MKFYDERDTLELAIQGNSIARFGDGELRLALGGAAASQKQDPELRKELLRALSHPSQALVCIPLADKRSPKFANWQKYRTPQIMALYKLRQYGSAFITRPDTAPWINTHDYWDRVADLWRGQKCILVTGDEKSLTPKLMEEAKSVRVVVGPRQHAYAEIGRLERETETFKEGPVFLCLGATATVLAVRLANKGVHALDLGHIGMFMKRHMKQFGADDVATPEYRALLQKRYQSPGWGASGYGWAAQTIKYAQEIGARTVLDYGCGRGTLKKKLDEMQSGLDVREYDPGIVGKDALPEPADLVMCTDVLEHIERDRLKNVLAHLNQLALRGMFLSIATSPAREVLPDGRNAHLIVEPASFWRNALATSGMNIVRDMNAKGYWVWVKK